MRGGPSAEEAHVASTPGAEGHGHGANGHGAPGGKDGGRALAAQVDKRYDTGILERCPDAGADWDPVPQFSSATGSGLQRSGRSRSRPGARGPAGRPERTRGSPLGPARLAGGGRDGPRPAAGAAAASVQAHRGERLGNNAHHRLESESLPRALVLNSLRLSSVAPKPRRGAAGREHQLHWSRGQGVRTRTEEPTTARDLRALSDIWGRPRLLPRPLRRGAPSSGGTTANKDARLLLRNQRGPVLGEGCSRLLPRPFRRGAPSSERMDPRWRPHLTSTAWSAGTRLAVPRHRAAATAGESS